MVGGAAGAFIGPVHRMAATMDGEAEFVSGCFSRDALKSRQAGEALHLDPARVYTDYRQMAEQEAKRPAGERLDFVSIVVTTSFHYEVARSFVEQGFNVVCDKPMTTSLDDARALRDGVRKAGTAFVLTGHRPGDRQQDQRERRARHRGGVHVLERAHLRQRQGGIDRPHRLTDLTDERGRAGAIGADGYADPA
jgi:hypothetical protein